MADLDRSQESGTFDARLVHALFLRGLGARLPAHALAQIRELGLDLSRPLSGSYPRELVFAAVATAAGALFPELPASEAHRALGLLLVRGFSSGWKARATLAAARAMGAEHAVGQLLGRHRTPSDFLVIEVRREASGHFVVTANLGAPYPEVLVGLAEGILDLLGARGARLRIEVAPEAEQLDVHLRG